MKSVCKAAVILVLFALGFEGARAQAPVIALSFQDGVAAGGSAAELSGAVMGGVPTGKATGEILQLSLNDVIKRGLQYNLGIILGQQALRSAHGAHLKAISEFLPNLAAGITETGQQINLASFGFSASGFPSIVGPFNLLDARLYLSQTLLDFNALNRARSEKENVKAAEFSYQNARAQVLLVCGSLYLRATSGKSRIEEVRAQLATAQALHTLALDQKQAGVAAGIDVLRSQVQLQQQQQRLMVAENEFEKDKLLLARAIGLPIGQGFALADTIPYLPLAPLSVDQALTQAYALRADYHGALARVSAAEAERKAATGERLPTLSLAANFGDNGRDPTSSHGAFAVAANLRIPIFQGERIHGKVLEADAAVQRRKAEFEDLRGKIYYEIQTALLDLKTAGERVSVARSAEELAKEQLAQARDRFSAGVANTIEVVQAQEALATAAENFLSSLYAYNIAKTTLARALGINEESYVQFLRGM
jgi:outer membrane protein TolC